MRCLVCSGVIAILASMTVHAQDVTRVEFPNRRAVGSYKIVSAEEPKRLTRNEADLARVSRPLLVPRGKTPLPIRGVVELAMNARLDITIAADANETLTQKLAAIAKIPPTQIVRLHCQGKIDEGGVAAIASLSQLVDLTVDGDQIWCGKAGLDCLNGLRRLRYAQFNLARDEERFGNNAFIATLLQLPELQFLEMPGDGLVDADIERLATHPGIVSLRIQSPKGLIGSPGLASLAKMTKLRELYICCVDTITDAEALEFTRLRSLERLTICTESPLTCQRQFRKLHPDCLFYLRGLDD